jgi:hypothetical protein
VHIVSDAGTLLALAKQIGSDNLINLLSSQHIKITCAIGFHVTLTQNENGILLNKFTFAELGEKTKLN